MKIFNFFVTVFILLSSFVSCTAFMSGRSYLSEMENESDAGFFTPNKDFPVMAGDNGRYWYTESERRARTPASEYDQLKERESNAIKEQRARLEASLPEEEQSLYSSVQNRLSTDSEKIYFLELPSRDKRDYIEARGWGRSNDKLNTAWENRLATRQKEVMMGMTKDEVMETVGSPVKVEVAGNPQNQNERWMYVTDNQQKYIYFESGRVGGWGTRP